MFNRKKEITEQDFISGLQKLVNDYAVSRQQTILQSGAGKFADHNEKRYSAATESHMRKKMFDRWMAKGCSKGCSLCDKCVKEFREIVETDE